jgi:hypothetical protein
MARPPLITAAGPCLAWSGLLLGGTVAAISKFRAPDVPRDALLRVGREQFIALRRAEAALAAAAVAAVAASPAPAAAALPVGVAVVAAAVQAGVVVPWVRREGEKRAKDGGKEAGAMAGAHGLQVGLEVLKLGTCVYAAYVAR